LHLYGEAGRGTSLGRSPRGVRLRDYTPCGHWQTHTVIAGLRVDGLTAPAVLDGPIDNPSFLAYVEQVLAPTLRPGDVVVLDNLAMPKQPEVQTAIERVGARLRLLPPYRPGFNPIEMAFCEAEGLLARRATAELRSGGRSRRDRAGAVLAARMRQLRPALRLPRSYGAMKNALKRLLAESLLEIEVTREVLRSEW